MPKEALEGSSEDGGLVRLKFVSYRNGKLFQSSRNNGSKLVSDGLSSNQQPGVVLVASVGKRSVSGLTQPVTYSVPRETTSFFYSCVYWNEIGKSLLSCSYHVIPLFYSYSHIILMYRKSVVYIWDQDTLVSLIGDYRMLF